MSSGRRTDPLVAHKFAAEPPVPPTVAACRKNQEESMAKRREPPAGGAPDRKGWSRREFFRQGAAAAGAGAVALAGVEAAEAAPHGRIRWDYEADVVVLGGGGTGLAAAVRAKDLGATVLVLEQNYDLGGKLSHSGGWTSLGGGDAIQERDRLGLDPEGWGLTAPLAPPEDL